MAETESAWILKEPGLHHKLCPHRVNGYHRLRPRNFDASGPFEEPLRPSHGCGCSHATSRQPLTAAVIVWTVLTYSRASPFSRLLFYLWLMLVLEQPTVFAQESATPQSEYDRALDQALTFHAQHDYESARQFMERAHALSPSARTLRGLGIVAFAQGQPLVALRYLDQALASDVNPLPIELQTTVEQLRAQIWSQVGRYEVHVEPATAELSLDGASADFYAPHILVLEPGAHTLSARAQGRSSYLVQLDAKPGARETLHIALALPVPAVVDDVAPAASFPRSDRAPSLPWWTPTLRYSGIAAGSALLLGGASLWTMGRLRLNRLIETCEEMASGSCTEKEAERRYDDERIGTLAVSSAVLVGAGAALLVSVAAIEIYSWRRRGQHVHAVLSPRSLGLRVNL